MDLNEVSVFIKVVQLGTFSGAAKALSMPNSTVSFKVSALEKRLGVTLIQRTTRKIHVTPLGQEYFNKCLQGLDIIQSADIEFLERHSEPRGQLRITAPAELGANLLSEIIPRYLAKFPKVSVDVILTDRRVDLLQEGIDLAIRAGDLKDSSLIAKKLGTVYFALFASPQYTNSHRPILTPADLKNHQLIDFTPMTTGEWKLISKSSSAKIPSQRRILVNDLRIVKQFAIAGSGVALLPTFFCLEAVRAKMLTRVLPEWHTYKAPVHFVYPAQKFVLPKLSEFINLASDDIKVGLRAFEIVSRT